MFALLATDVVRSHTARLMARVTVEDCLEKIPNRFALTVLAARRARALAEGRGHPMVECDNKEGVTALREVAEGRVRYRENVAEQLRLFIDEQRQQLQITSGEHTFLEAASLRALEDDDDEDDAGPDVDERVEELHTDPEVMNLQAKKGAAKDTDDDEEEAEADVDEDDPAAATTDDDDLPEGETDIEGLGDETAEEDDAEEEPESDD